MQNDPNLNPNVTSAGWGLIGKIFAIVLCVVAAIAIYSALTNSSDPPANSPVGQTRLIRVGAPMDRGDLPVFTTKDALMRFMLAVSKDDSAQALATMTDTFLVMDYTPVRIVDYDPIGKGKGLFNIEVLEGPKRGRTGWVMDMDLRDR